MVQNRGEISEFRDRISEYYGNIGEQLAFTYNRLGKIEAKIKAISEHLVTITETANADRDEFEDTIHTLVESMKELVKVPMMFPSMPQSEEES
jgi:archaellum component FlaC